MQQVLNEINSRGEFTGQRPSTSEYAAFRRIMNVFEPIDRIPEDQRTDEEKDDWALMVEELYRTFSSPWYAWHRPSIEYTEYLLQEFGAEVLLAWAR